MRTTPLKTTLAVLISSPVLIALIGLDLIKLPFMLIIFGVCGFVGLIEWLRIGRPIKIPYDVREMFLCIRMWHQMLHFPIPSWME